MLAEVISVLIYICLLALVVYIVIWVITGVLEIPIPPKVIQILWVIVALIVLLMLVNVFLGGMKVPRLL